MTSLMEKARLIGKILRSERLVEAEQNMPIVESPESVTAKPQASSDAAFFDVIKDCADLLIQLEDMEGRLDEKAKPLAEHVKINLQEIIERAGANRIDGEVRFDVARHQPVPAKVVAKGSTIKATLGPGYEVGGKIVKRARVVLE